MTSWYVDSNATGTNAGTSWANACTRLQQLSGIRAGGSWIAGATAITMSEANPGWVTAGMNVYDIQKAASIGTVASYVGTALTLASGATVASAGATDHLQFGGPTGAPAAGDDVFCSNLHNETTTVSTNVEFINNTVNNPISIYSTTTTHSPPTPADFTPGATINTANGANFSLNSFVNTSSMYIYGFTFKIGAGATTTNIGVGGTNLSWTLDTCTGDLSAHSGANSAFRISGGQKNIIKNATWKPGATTHQFDCVGSRNYIYGFTLDTSAVSPLWALTGNNGQDVFLEGADLRNLGAHSVAASQNVHYAWIKDSFLPTNFAQVTSGFPGGRTVFSRCLNSVGAVGNFASHYAIFDYAGTEVPDTGVTRVGSLAADPNGNAYSKKIAPTANCKPVIPYLSMPMVTAFMGAPGVSKTITVFGVVAGGALPNDNDVWMEVVYLGDASDCLGYITPVAPNSGLKNQLYTGAAVASDVSTWNGGLSTPAPFKLTATITPQQKGPIGVRVWFGKASGGPYYIDPAFTIT